jgi:Brp/Blh family beta-carotene 15,15'-monooxygenase
MTTDSGKTTSDRTVFRLAFVVPWIVLGTAMVAVTVFGGPSRQYQLLPFAASILVFGLPHGAADHLTPSWARNEPPTRRWIGLVGALYLIVGLAYAWVWFVFPVAAFVLFILITWFHWGQGELHPLVDLIDRTHLRTRPARLLTIAVRGSLPMLVPLVAFPAEYRWVAAQLVGLFVAPDLRAVDVVFSPAGQTAVAVAVGSLICVSLVVSNRGSSDRHAWIVDASEILFLLVYFLTVPPILAVGLFFCFWHSLRHIVRLMLLDTVAQEHLAAGDPQQAFARFARQAAPLSIGALGLLGGVALVVPVAPGGWTDLFGVYLVGIAVLTAPHVVVVTWLDIEAGFWTSTETGR